MIELPDDELDKLFRKSSEEFDPTYETQDWSALKKRLDEEEGSTAASWLRQWWPVGILTLLIFAGLGGYYLLEDVNFEKGNSVRISSIRIDSAKTSVLPKPEDTQAIEDLRKKENISSKNLKENERFHFTDNQLNRKKSIDSEIQNAVSKAIEQKQKNTDQARVDKNISSQLENFSDALKPIEKESSSIRRSAWKAEVNPERQENKKVRQPKTVLNNSGEINSYEKTIESVISKNANTENIIVPEDYEILRSVIPLAHLPFNQKLFLSLPNIEVMERQEPPTQEEDWSLSPKIAVRFGYSPDLSSVGLNNFSKPGSSFSLMAEYGLTHRLYVQTGVGRSEKIYFANASEYEWPADWKKGPKAISTDAVCKIIEVPLNIRYDLVQQKRFRFFAGAGTSSYYMQKENYIYNYAPHTYNIIWKDHEAKTGWFLLSHINTSVGYERRITNKLSLLAEPYVKIPVKKVGYGKVNLLTAGIWISLRYTPVFFK